MVAAAVVGAAVVGAGATVASSGAASRASRRATDKTIAAQEQARVANTQTLQPYMQVGNRASSAIEAMLGNAPGGSAAQDAAFEQFRNSTGFRFQQEEGNRAITAALGRRGQLESGAAAKSAARFNQNLANQSAMQYLGLQQEQQRVGLSAANASAGVQTNFANNVSNAFQNQGNVQANAALSTGSAINSALGSAVGALSYSQGLKSSYGDPWTRGAI